VAKWLGRYREGGLAGLRDRTSRPRSAPTRTKEILRRRVLERRQKRLVGRLRSLEPPEPPNRHEHVDVCVDDHSRLTRWLHDYSFQRQHSSLGGEPPVSRVNNLFSRDSQAGRVCETDPPAFA